MTVSDRQETPSEGSRRAADSGLPPPSAAPVSQAVPASSSRPQAGSTRAVRIGDRIVLGITRHWLALFNLALLAFVGMPFLAPLLMHLGAAGPARLIYLVYAPTCHQLPDRSYFLFGEQRVYTVEQLEDAGVLTGTGLLERRRFVGDETLGWKVALCERDVAIYGSMIVAGLIFGLVRRRVPKLPVKIYLLFLIPIAVDGLSQLVGLRTSNWWLRTLTGALFGMATVWLAYPYVQESMDATRRDTERKLSHETGQKADS